MITHGMSVSDNLVFLEVNLTTYLHTSLNMQAYICGSFQKITYCNCIMCAHLLFVSDIIFLAHFFRPLPYLGLCLLFFCRHWNLRSIRTIVKFVPFCLYMLTIFLSDVNSIFSVRCRIFSIVVGSTILSTLATKGMLFTKVVLAPSSTYLLSSRTLLGEVIQSGLTC